MATSLNIYLEMGREVYLAEKGAKLSNVDTFLHVFGGRSLSARVSIIDSIPHCYTENALKGVKSRNVATFVYRGLCWSIYH